MGKDNLPGRAGQVKIKRRNVLEILDRRRFQGRELALLETIPE
jgi:hypothetical protein